jgi:hypothetical protein
MAAEVIEDLKYYPFEDQVNDPGGFVMFSKEEDEVQALKEIILNRRLPCVMVSCPPQYGGINKFRGQILWKPVKYQS